MNAGRKRSFDKEAALDKAMELFWINGYSGTSLQELTEAMGINKPSLYAAFGNKESLFIASVEHYMQRHANAMEELFAPELSLQERLYNMLNTVVELVTDPKLPGGCFMTMNLIEANGDCLPAAASAEIHQAYDSQKNMVCEFFANEQALRNISDSSSAEALAGYLITIQFGLAVMGRHETNKKDLKQIIDQSLLSFEFTKH